MHGGHATVPTGGDDALTVHVSLSRPPEVPEKDDPTGYVAVVIDQHPYRCENSVPPSPETINKCHALARVGTISISARGGDGGNGGSGGKGQNGGPGMGGSDATRYSRGTDGRQGGMGGVGGM